MTALALAGLLLVAVAISVSAIIQVAVLFAAWNRHSGNKGGNLVYGTYLKTTVAGILLGMVLWRARRYVVHWIDPASFS